MFIEHRYYFRFPGCQSWSQISKVKYFNLRRRKNSKEFISKGIVKHYLEIPYSWTDRYNK